MSSRSRAATVLSMVFAGLYLSSCATVTQGTTQKIAIESDPPGAACELHRGGAQLNQVPRTPRVVEVGRGKETMEVRCTLAAYRPTTELVEAKFGGATIGNVLAGGLIGIVIDAASGANMAYPDRVVVLMEPQTFGDEATRDAFFGKHKARIDAIAKTELQNVTSQCGNQPREFCDADRKKITDRQAAALADLDRRRLAAPVAATGTGNSKQ